MRLKEYVLTISIESGRNKLSNLEINNIARRYGGQAFDSDSWVSKGVTWYSVGIIFKTRISKDRVAKLFATRGYKIQKMTD